MKLDHIVRYIILAGVFIIPFIPFYVASSMFFPYITGKNFAFRIIVELMVALWVPLMLWRPQYRPRFSWIHAAIGAFLVIIFLADLFGANFFQSFWSNFERMEGYITLLHLGAYLLVMSTMLSTEKLWHIWFITTLSASAVLSAAGLLPALGSLGSYNGRVDATFGNPIYLAIYNVFHMYIALYLWTKLKKAHPLQWLYGVAIVLNMIAMVYSQTRGAVLGFIGGAMITAILIALLERERVLLRKTALGVLVGVVVVVGGFFAVRDMPFVHAIPVLNRFASISLDSIQHDTFGTRLKIWNMAWQGVKEHPLLGWGQNNFDYVFSKYYTPDMYNQEPWFDRTHDIFFDWLIAGGFLGFISYFAIIGVTLYYLWLYRRKQDSHPMSVTERSLWTGLLVSYTLHNIFVFDNITSYILYFSILSYILWRVTEKKDPVLEKKSLSQQTALTLVLPVSCVLAIALIYTINIRAIMSAQNLIQALSGHQEGVAKNLDFFKQALAYDGIGRQEVREQLVQTTVQLAGDKNVTQDIRNQLYTLTQTELTKELARNPDSARLHIFMGTFYERFAQNDLALAQLEQAKALTPKKQIVYFQIGDVYLRTGSYDKALAQFKYAYDLDHSYNEAALLYALGALYAGNNTLADSLLNKQFGTTTVDDDRLVIGYNAVHRFQDAARVLVLKISKDPSNPQLQVQLAALYYQAGQKALALKTLQDLAVAQPQYKKQLDVFIADIKAGRVPGSSN